jgi:hypothetical protein
MSMNIRICTPEAAIPVPMAVSSATTLILLEFCAAPLLREVVLSVLVGAADDVVSDILGREPVVKEQ